MIGPEERDRIIFGCGNFGGLGSSPAFRVLGDDREQALALLDAVRARLQIATKVGNPHGGPPHDRPLSRTQVADHLEQSLRRLGLEQIGLYYLHEFDPQTPLEETLEALDRALTQGKIAAFGISNASLADLKNVLALSN